MSLNKKRKKLGGFSLAEILLSMGLFSMLSTSVIFFSLDSLRINKNTSSKITSSLYFQEYYNALMNSKNDTWSSLVNITDAGDKKLSFLNEKYQFVDGKENINGLNLYFNVLNAYRDSQGKIVSTGGTLDTHTRIISLKSDWIDIYGNLQTYSSDIYVNDWNTLELLQKTDIDFNAGVNNSTIVTKKIDGEVQLGAIIFPDWCRPTIALSEFDLPGSAVSKTVFANTSGKVYLGTAGTTSLNSLTKLNIAGVDNPILTVEGTFAGYKVNNIFVVGNYAYLATTNDSKEVIILNVSVTPYTEVGYFNATGTTDANSVYVVGTVGYVATGRKVQTFDLTANTGSRTKLGELTMAESPVFFGNDIISQIVVVQNYIYASLWNDWNELAIANAANPRSMFVTSQTTVNNKQTLDIYVNPAGTRAYFGTTTSSSEREFFIVDVSSKTGSRPIIGSYDSNGMNVDGIAIIEADHRAVLVGNAAEEYQALDITNEATPVKCGGMQLDSGISDIDTVVDAQGNAFSYIVSKDPTKEFKILRGGPGNGHEDGYGYPSTGSFTSSIIDSTSTTSQYFTFKWTGTVPAATTLKLQLRTGTSIGDIASQTFVGPDGTSSTYFTSQTATSIPGSLNNKQYIQYKAFFTSDTFSTPVLNDITITYQK